VVASAALVRSGCRLRRLARPSYDRLVEAARHSAVQHVDETGWKIGGRSAWLWVFADEHATLYRIRKSRGHEGGAEVLGEDYQGVLVSDCFLAYDPLNFKKSKCSSHLLKRCSEVEQSKSRGAVRFSRRVAALLRRAMTWWFYREPLDAAMMAKRYGPVPEKLSPSAIRSSLRRFSRKRCSGTQGEQGESPDFAGLGTQNFPADG
jgi:hypothetical protein